MKDFFERLNELGKPKRNDIIEKDYHLHRLLYQISQDKYLRDNLVFKGGTCLMKAYTDYYRFSEDIDFTWQEENIWKYKNKSEIAKLCSMEINKLVEHFKLISDKLDLKFSGDKTNNIDVHISSGGRMVLFFIGYKSDILNMETRIKIEINFMDITLYPFIKNKLKSYIENIESEELRFLYEKPCKEYSTPVSLKCYDSQEIFIEKCRASMTRKTYKLRDLIDIYFMNEYKGYSILKYKHAIKKKTKFMLDLYERYKENIEFLEFPKTNLLDNEELKLMLIPTPKDLDRNISQLHEQLNKVRDELLLE